MSDFVERPALAAPPALSDEDRARLTFELHRLGLAMLRERFRREAPDASEADLDRRLHAWLRAEAEKEFAGREDLRPRTLPE